MDGFSSRHTLACLCWLMLKALLPLFCCLFSISSSPIRGLIFWLNREHSGRNLTALEMLISDLANAGAVITVIMYCLSLGLQCFSSFASIHNKMTPHVIIILAIIWLQCGVPSLTRPPQSENIAAPMQMSEP